MSQTKKGSVLVFSLIILSVMLLIAITMSTTSTLDLKSSMATQKSTQAFQTADSAAESIFKEIKNDPTPLTSKLSTLGSCTGGKLTLTMDKGEAKISFFNKSDAIITTCDEVVGNVGRIKSVGTFSGTVRAVEMNINNL